MWDQAAPIHIRLEEIAAKLPNEFALMRSPPRLEATELVERILLVEGTTVCFTGAGPGRTRVEWAAAVKSAGLVPVSSVIGRLGM